ncbi:RNA-directed DNA polymerase from mobile element jockey [Trichonephila inaurata madagascariensis]|uniref:RNA-directed DNA polymerase from mobile element jockey n=1 Tax=Trichonephila inaurata madagascariensis TaxID=2747483 RepID=A0A8X6K4J0_9ARAC|nr:RNA-directed DNA polymerase from mobile element jockey [Trichonephila inaurata madagascariensis]
MISQKLVARPFVSTQTTQRSWPKAKQDLHHTLLHRHSGLEDWYRNGKSPLTRRKLKQSSSPPRADSQTTTRTRTESPGFPPGPKTSNILASPRRKLKFQTHFLNLKSKIRALASIYYPISLGNFPPLTIKNRLLINTSLLRPVILYASPVWGHAASTTIDLLEHAQNLIIRKLTNSPWFVRNADIRSALQLKTVGKQ